MLGRVKDRLARLAVAALTIWLGAASAAQAAFEDITMDDINMSKGVTAVGESRGGGQPLSRAR